MSSARYNRHIILPGFGQEGQDKLRKASVLIVGAGGLGSPVIQYLAAAGVGNLVIVDGDVVDISNLQRQVIFEECQVGINKAVAARQFVGQFNSEIEVDIVDTFLTPENAIGLFKDVDLIVDGSDNFQTRYLVNDAACLANKPVVFGSIFKYEGQVSVFNLHGGPTYRCLFPEPPSPGEVPNCSEIGVLGVLPGVIGNIMATEAIKIITGIGETLTGRLLIYDARRMTFNEMKVSRSANQISELEENYDVFCGVEQVKSIDVIELKKWLDQNKDFDLVDVREAFERDICMLESIHIPLGLIESATASISRTKPVVIYCHHGMRSQAAINMLAHHGFNNLINLEGGIHDWSIRIEPDMPKY